MAMIEGVTLTTTTTYVQNHEDEARSLIMALIDAIHFFKTKKVDTLNIVKKHCSELLKMRDDEEWDCFYETKRRRWKPKPYPSLEALQNVFALALKRDPEIKEFNPLALWDLHYLRRLTIAVISTGCTRARLSRLVAMPPTILVYDRGLDIGHRKGVASINGSINRHQRRIPRGDK